MIRIVIVDDHALISQGLTAIFGAKYPEIRVVATFLSGEKFLEKISSLGVDVVLMDIVMDGMDGIETTRRLVEKQPQAKVIMLTNYADREQVTQALDAGAKGYVLKEADPLDIVDAIRIVHRGGFFSSSKIFDDLRQSYHQKVDTSLSKLRLPPEIAHLTAREKEVCVLIAHGLDNPAIADKLCLSEKTIRNYISTIYEVIGVHKRTEAAAWFKDRGLK